MDPTFVLRRDENHFADSTIGVGVGVVPARAPYVRVENGEEVPI